MGISAHHDKNPCCDRSAPKMLDKITWGMHFKFRNRDLFMLKKYLEINAQKYRGGKGPY